MPHSVILPPIFQTSPSFEPIWFSQCFPINRASTVYLTRGGSFKLLKYFTYRFMLAVLPTFICVFSSLCQLMDQLLHYLLSRQEWPRTIPSTILNLNLAPRVFYSLTTSCYVINDAIDGKLVPRFLLFVFCVRLKRGVNDERKILGTRLAHENEVGQK